MRWYGEVLLLLFLSGLHEVRNTPGRGTTWFMEYTMRRKWNQVTIFGIDNEDFHRNVKSAFLEMIKMSYVKKKTFLRNYNEMEEKESIFSENDEVEQQFICFWSDELVKYIMKAGEKGYFSSSYEWLIILNDNTTIEDLSHNLANVSLYLDSQVVVGAPSGGMQKWILSEVWYPGPGMGINRKFVGGWEPEKRLQLHDLGQKFVRRKDLDGFHFQVATIATKPYVTLKPNKTLQNFCHGYIADIWHLLQDQLNFTYSATETLFGSLQEDNTTWNGMVGLLQKNRVHVAAAPLSITYGRSLAIDFSVAIQFVSSRIYLRRPDFQPNWNLYTLPFDFTLWTCIPGFIGVMGLSLWFLNNVLLNIGCQGEEIPLSSAVWIMFSSSLQQGSDIEPTPFSTKLIVVVGYMTSLILYTCYSAILVSILTTMQPKMPFTTFEELCQNGVDWNLGVRTNTALADALALSPEDSPMKCAWNKNVLKDPRGNLPKSNGEALRRLLRGNYAFFANKEYIIYLVQNHLRVEEAEQVIDTGKDFLVRGIGFGLQKNSPFTNLFNYYLNKMSKSGHMNKLQHKWWPDISSEPDEGYPTPGMPEVFTLFVALAAGLVASAVILFAERRYFHYYNVSSNGHNKSTARTFK